MDDLLGHGVAGGGLGSEKVHPGGKLEVGVGLEPLVQIGDVQHVQELALILVQPLDLHVEHGIGIEDDAGLTGHIVGKGALVLRLDIGQALEYAGVVPVFLQLLNGVGAEQVVVPAAAFPDQRVQRGVDLGQPAPVVDAVGNVLELAWVLGIGVVEDVLFQDLRVKRGHPIDGETGADTQVGHTDLAAPDHRHVPHLGLVAVKRLVELGLIAIADLDQKLPDAGQQGLDELLGPALQGLGENGVVGVGHGVGDDVPRLVPAVALLVQQDAHELRDDQGGVGVVDLNDVLFMEITQGAVLRLVLAADGLDGGGDEEILLLEPQGLALVVVVLGVEHLGDDLGHGLLLHRLQILAGGEELHIHRVGALGVPQPQDVGVLGAVTGDLHVPGDGQYVGAALVRHPVASVLVPDVLDPAAKVDLFRLIHLGDEPGVAHRQPVVGQLHLLAVDDLLLKDAQLIADGIAGGWDLQGGHRVQIAGGQAAQAPVAQPSVGLDFKEVGGGEAQILDGPLQLLQNAQVVGVFHQRAAHQKLQGQVVDLAGVGALHLVLGLELPG